MPLCHPGLWLKAAVQPSSPEWRDSPLSLSRGRAEGVPALLVDQTPCGGAAQGQPSVGQGGQAGLGVSWKTHPCPPTTVPPVCPAGFHSFMHSCIHPPTNLSVVLPLGPGSHGKIQKAWVGTPDHW